MSPQSQPTCEKLTGWAAFWKWIGIQVILSLVPIAGTAAIMWLGQSGPDPSWALLFTNGGLALIAVSISCATLSDIALTRRNGAASSTTVWIVIGSILSALGGSFLFAAIQSFAKSGEPVHHTANAILSTAVFFTAVLTGALALLLKRR